MGYGYYHPDFSDMYTGLEYEEYLEEQYNRRYDMKTMWLLQGNLVDKEHYSEIVSAISELGIKYETFDIIPFDTTPINVDETEYRIIPYGSTNMMEKCIEKNYSGFFYNRFDSKPSTWIEKRDDILNQNPIICPLSEAKEYMKIHKHKMFFIKPNKDLKDFTGEILDGKSIERWINDISFGKYLFNEDLEVIISEPKYIKWEARFFIVGRKVVSASYYRKGGYMHREEITDNELLNTAEEMASKWLPYECVTMDLCETNEGIKIVEFNNINCSGFYKCDILKVVRELTMYVEKMK